MKLGRVHNIFATLFDGGDGNFVLHSTPDDCEKYVGVADSQGVACYVANILWEIEISRETARKLETLRDAGWVILDPADPSVFPSVNFFNARGTSTNVKERYFGPYDSDVSEKVREIVDALYVELVGKK